MSGGGGSASNGVHVLYKLQFCVPHRTSCLFTNLMEQSPWETDSRSASQYIPVVLRCPTLDRLLSQINAFHILTTYLTFILILSSHLRLGLSGGLFHSGFPNKNFAFSPSASVLMPHYPRNIWQRVQMCCFWRLKTRRPLMFSEDVDIAVWILTQTKRSTRLKGKVAPVLNEVPRLEDMLGSGGIAPPVLSLDIRWRRVVSFMTRPV
jgi:hypothetical protein